MGKLRFSGFDEKMFFAVLAGKCFLGGGWRDYVFLGFGGRIQYFGLAGKCVFLILAEKCSFTGLTEKCVFMEICVLRF